MSWAFRLTVSFTSPALRNVYVPAVRLVAMCFFPCTFTLQLYFQVGIMHYLCQDKLKYQVSCYILFICEHQVFCIYLIASCFCHLFAVYLWSQNFWYRYLSNLVLCVYLINYVLLYSLFIFPPFVVVVCCMGNNSEAWSAVTFWSQKHYPSQRGLCSVA